MRGRIFRILAVVVFCFAIMTNGTGMSMAGGGATGGSTEITQKMNNAELVVAVQKATEQVKNQIQQITHQVTQITNQITQITNQITMIKDMVLNTLNLPNQLFGQIMGAVNKIKGVFENIKGVAHTMSNIDQVFKQKFKSYDDMISSGKNTVTDFQEEYKQVLDTQRETITTTMKAIGVMYDQYTSDADLLTQLQSKAETAEGRNQILQAGNQLNAFNAQELMKLRELTMMQANMYATVTESERTQKELDMLKEELSQRAVTFEAPKFKLPSMNELWDSMGK